MLLLMYTMDNIQPSRRRGKYMRALSSYFNLGIKITQTRTFERDT